MKKNLLLVTLMLNASVCIIAQVKTDIPSAKTGYPTKTAYVEMAKIFSADADAPEEARDYIDRIKKDMMDRELKLRKEYERYTKEAQEFQTSKEKNPAKAEELRKMEANLQLEQQAAQEYSMRAQQELQAMLGPVVQKAAEAVAKRLGWDAVDYMPKLYVDPKMDITSEVIAEMNKEYRAQKAAQKFKKAEKKAEPKAA